MPPEPECWIGYPVVQAYKIVGDQALELQNYLWGQTMALCDGQRYDHGLHSWVDTCAPAHGPVVYARDLERFLAGLPVID